MQKKFFCAFALLAVQLALADFTPHDEAEASGNCREGYLFAAGSGKTSAEAKKNAIIEIGNKVSASVETMTEIIRFQYEKDGIPFDSNSYSEKNEIVSKLTNAYAVKEIGSPKPKGGLYEFKGYMCNADAAQPYLNSLKERAGRLKNAVLALSGKSGKKEAWENVVSIYKTLKDLEGVLKNLGQTNHALQKEYEADYAKAEKEYKAFAEQSGKGIYVESTDAALKRKMSSYLSKQGCALAEEPENSALHLKLQVSEEQQADAIMNVAYCTPSVYASLGDSKTGRDIYEDEVKLPKAGHVDMGKACEQALDKGLPKIWGAFQGKIQKEHCKQ